MICGYDSCRSEMSRESCCRCMKGIMVLVGIISGLVFTAAAVLLFINSLLPSAGTGILIALITALVFMMVLLTAAFASGNSSGIAKCIRCHLGSLFFGIFGTIASGLIAVSADIAAGSVFAAVMVGLTAFFFAYMAVSTLFTVLCLTDW